MSTKESTATYITGVADAYTSIGDCVTIGDGTATDTLSTSTAGTGIVYSGGTSGYTYTLGGASSGFVVTIDPSDPVITKIDEKIEKLKETMFDLFLTNSNFDEIHSKINKLEEKINSNEATLREILMELRHKNDKKN